MRRSLTIPFAALVLSSSACGDDPVSVAPDPEPEPAVPAEIVVEPVQDTLNALGDTLQLSAVVRGEDGAEIADADIVWTPVDEAVATVDDAGRVVARTPGTARIRARAGDAVAEAAVVVRQVPAMVVLDWNSLTLSMGETFELSAVVADSNGAAVDGAEVVWTSADSEVAAVDADGRVTAGLEGETTIRAESGALAAEADVAVLGRIAFTTDRDGNDEIYIMDSDGSAPVNLTRNAAADADPAWSPDGASIAFTSDRDGNDEIYRMNEDGTGVQRLTDHPAYDGEPAWSPDGRWIVFTSTRGGSRDVWGMSASGDSVVQVTDHPADDEDPVWSPDGEALLFSTNRDGDWEVYLYDPDTGTVVNLTNSPGSDEVQPAWSPDGTKILFVSDRDGDREVYVMNADGSGEPVNLTTDPADDVRPSWSATGTRIVFETDRSGDYEVYVLNIDGSAPLDLTDSLAREGRPAWRPRR